MTPLQEAYRVAHHDWQVEHELHEDKLREQQLLERVERMFAELHPDWTVRENG